MEQLHQLEQTTNIAISVIDQLSELVVIVPNTPMLLAKVGIAQWKLVVVNIVKTFISVFYHLVVQQHEPPQALPVFPGGKFPQQLLISGQAEDGAKLHD